MCLARMKKNFTVLNPTVRFNIALITWNSHLVPLFQGLFSSNLCKFELSRSGFLGFCRNRTDDLGIASPALWPPELVLHRVECYTHSTHSQTQTHMCPCHKMGFNVKKASIKMTLKSKLLFNYWWGTISWRIEIPFPRVRPQCFPSAYHG